MSSMGAVMVRSEEAQRELARRELARRHLVDFETYVAPYYRPARHHRLVGEYLELVETFVRTRGATGIGRLLILEPPRHGKSEQVSRHFPAWTLGRLPDTRVIVTSYNADLAAKFSRAARDIVLGERFRALFGDLAGTNEYREGAKDAKEERFNRDGQDGQDRDFYRDEGDKYRGDISTYIFSGGRGVQVSDDSRSVKSWDLAAPHRGGMISAGVGGGITGSGANLLIVDDPFKSREDAEADKAREAVWEWWTSTAYTRLENGAAVVLCLTRWHQDDLAGRLLKAMGSDAKADRWVTLCLPGLAEGKSEVPGAEFEAFQHDRLREGVWVDREDALGRQAGEALWPEKYNEDDLLRIRANIGEYDWEALYQQRPYSRSGNFFRREWFAIVENAPKLDEIQARMWFWDKAGSQEIRASTNYACGAVLSLTRDGLVFVENVARRQCTPGERNEMMVQAMRADLNVGRRIDCIWHQQDPGSAGLDSAQATNQLLVKAGFGLARFEPVTGDKVVRAGPWSSALQGGMVRIVRGGWNEAFIEEHVAFPKGTFDDQVDTASWGFGKTAVSGAGVLLA